MIAKRLDVLFPPISGSKIFFSNPNHPSRQTTLLQLWLCTVGKSQYKNTQWRKGKKTNHPSGPTTLLQVWLLNTFNIHMRGLYAFVCIYIRLFNFPNSHRHHNNHQHHHYLHLHHQDEGDVQRRDNTSLA